MPRLQNVFHGQCDPGVVQHCVIIAVAALANLGVELQPLLNSTCRQEIGGESHNERSLVTYVVALIKCQWDFGADVACVVQK